MDSAWFAVDRDGHVAYFETGEAGACPETAYLGEDYGAMLDEVRAATPRTTAIHDLEGYAALNAAGRVGEVGPDQGRHLSPEMFPGGGPCMCEALIFLKDQESLSHFSGVIAGLGPKSVPTSAGFGLIVAGLDVGSFRALHDQGACQGCFPFYGKVDPEDLADSGSFQIAEAGLFRYDHSTDNWMAGPYARTERPGSPVLAADLPPDVIKDAVHFDGRFEETPLLQPAEHWPSQAWGAAWLATDGKTVSPFPGKQKEYQEEIAQLEGEKGFVFLDTPRPPPTPGRPARTSKPWWKWW